jgi:glyoxylase-like metal-dependent hydrolase (beta-lactamase superfamily II)
MKTDGPNQWRIVLLAANMVVLPLISIAGAGHMEGMSPQEQRVSPPTTLKKVARDLYFLYDDPSSNSAFLVTEEGVLVVDTRQHPRHGYRGPGQNPGDTLVYFPQVKTLYTGGPFSRKNWPNTSFTPSIDGWSALLKKLSAMDVDQYLPGHGDVGTKQDLLDEAKLLEDLQAGIKAAIAKRMSREEMVKNLHFREYKDLRNYDRLHGFIESTHQLLTTEKSAFQLP